MNNNIAQDSGSPLPRMELGKSGVFISPLGLGTWQWGDRMFWNFGQGYAETDVLDAFETSLQAGVDFYDTAEVYGSGRSERLLGQYVAAATPPPSGKFVIATKFMPLPYRLSKAALLRALKGSLERLGMEQVDLYQIHWPFPPVRIETWADALADVVQAGLTRAVGVSNYNADQMRRAHAALKARGVPLASNQVEYSLLNRSAEKKSLLALCNELGITLIAYSPIAKGMLTGKYTPQNPPPGLRARAYSPAYLAKIQPLLQRMREMGQDHGGKTLTQVALNWVMCKGAVAIPGAKNARQALENVGALGWCLAPEYVVELDQLSDLLQR